MIRLCRGAPSSALPLPSQTEVRTAVPRQTSQRILPHHASVRPSTEDIWDIKCDGGCSSSDQHRWPGRLRCCRNILHGELKLLHTSVKVICKSNAHLRASKAGMIQLFDVSEVCLGIFSRRRCGKAPRTSTMSLVVFINAMASLSF